MKPAGRRAFTPNVATVLGYSGAANAVPPPVIFATVSPLRSLKVPDVWEHGEDRDA
jgi:hypothetical protein